VLTIAPASTVTYGSITNYHWAFGDGATAETTTPKTTHVYSTGGSFPATVTETDTAGTSTSQVFGGKTMNRNGGSSAETSRTFSVTQVLAWVTEPGNVTFAGVLNGKDSTQSTTLALDVGDGTLAAGWNISLTSTTFSTGGGSAHTLSTSATTVASAPTNKCDTTCTLAANSVSYPYTVPAGSTAPTATKLFDAAAASAIGNQTVTPTFKLSIPANTYAGTYTSTWTFTLATGP
jgi:hypothetical protein